MSDCVLEIQDNRELGWNVCSLRRGSTFLYRGELFIVITPYVCAITGDYTVVFNFDKLEKQSLLTTTQVDPVKTRLVIEE